jgi:hypothetical protein
VVDVSRVDRTADSTRLRHAAGPATPARLARVRRQLAERAVETARRSDHDLAALARRLAGEGAA